MEELFKKLFGFFESEKVSVSRKITVPVLIVLALFLLDNISGVSYYLVNGMKVEYITKIENAKEKCNSDSTILSYFDGMMTQAMYRKNVFQRFASLFENSNVRDVRHYDLSPAKIVSRTHIKDFFPTLERNQLWHTITSSLFGILGLCMVLYAFIALIFEKGKLADKTSILLRITMTTIGLVFLIWLCQWLFAFIPIIAGRAYINYLIQGLINIIAVVIVFWKIGKN